jgi:hypothetical protein
MTSNEAMKEHATDMFSLLDRTRDLMIGCDPTWAESIGAETTTDESWDELLESIGIILNKIIYAQVHSEE